MWVSRLAAPARADAVVDWNIIAMQAISTANRGAPLLDIAVVHVAIYDAVQASDRRFEPYAVHIPGATGSPAAAAATAADDVLVTRFPAQAETLNAIYGTYLSAHGLAADDPGVLVGRPAAAGVLALRANDGSFPSSFPPFLGSTGPGAWRPTPSYLPGPPPGFAPGATPWLAGVLPFTVKSPSQFRAEPAPELTSEQYAKDYNEVKALGALFSSTRTAEQTDIGYFYNDNHPQLWNRLLRNLALTHLDNIGDTARLFALVNLAMADGLITCWETKFRYNFWRPITAIQEGNDDGNPATAGDPSWQPLVNTPNYPDYTSGATALSAAATRSLALYFGTDKMTFEVTSNFPLAVRKTRTYDRFSDAVKDVVDARVYIGIHFRTADAAARAQGQQVAHWVFQHFLRPIR